ncbi:ATP-binding protein [Modestobacter sp. VKM Ac-2984]|uniref:ATP-binding protein n=1 Tax=Modestobacter sp. VKM Ac-2984 TaxID=3004138 RepID=UPI0022AA9433|nr:ATP-binding protein [Modestobacter sp. VKM Ac-2984]MCZ2814924.1 ATP-binding protein [Modestobacter sp. VKM Ac-2984]
MTEDADTLEELSFPGELGLVRFLSADRRELHGVLRGGAFFFGRDAGGIHYEVGDVIFIRPREEGGVEVRPAPPELWPNDSWVGVVKLRAKGKTVLDTGGRWQLIDDKDKGGNWRVGQTVEVSDRAGVVDVLSEEPLRIVDDSVSDEVIVELFKQDVSSDLDFDDFGGLSDVVRRARQLVEFPLLHREALATIGARPIKGVLFVGSPGTGKTMLARIIASRAEATFYEVSGPQVFSKWYGESERILRVLFADAAKQERAIIFFDEIDSVAGRRTSEAHEASRRVVAQLLTLMDGFNAANNVVVIAATNRPQDLDEALRRPGRFDWEMRFPLPDKSAREAILRVSSSRLETRGPLSHHVVAGETEGWSPAELSVIWSEAALFAVADGRASIVDEDYLAGFEAAAQRRRVSEGQVEKR